MEGHQGRQPANIFTNIFANFFFFSGKNIPANVTTFGNCPIDNIMAISKNQAEEKKKRGIEKEK